MASFRVIRLVLGAFVPLTVCCIAVVPPLVFWSHLPDPLASHFGFSGTPTGLRRDFRSGDPPQASDLGKLWISPDFRSRM
jgi:hypothetical protein